MKLSPGPERPVFIKLLCFSCFRELAAESFTKNGLRIIRSRWPFHPLFGDMCLDCNEKYPTMGSAPDDPDDEPGAAADDRTTSAPPRRRPMEKEMAILAALAGSITGLTATEIATMTNFKRTSILRRLAALGKYGKVQRRGTKFLLKKSGTTAKSTTSKVALRV